MFCVTTDILLIVVQLLSCVWLFALPHGLQHTRPPLSFTFSWSLLRFMSLSWWCYSATSSSASPFFAFSLSQHRGYVFSLFSGSVGLKHMHLLQFPIIEKAVSFFYQVRKIFPVAGSSSLAFWCVHSTCWILLPSVSYSNAFSPTNLTSDYLCWKN